MKCLKNAKKTSIIQFFSDSYQDNWVVCLMLCPAILEDLISTSYTTIRE